MEPEKSATSIVYDHLASVPDTLEFTAATLAASTGVTESRASSALSMLAKAGFVKVVDRQGRSFVYRIDDRNAEVRVSSRPGPGSKMGQGKGSNRVRVVVAQRSLADRLLAIAGDLERMEVDLRQVPTEQLLGEMVRRERAKRNGGE